LPGGSHPFVTTDRRRRQENGATGLVRKDRPLRALALRLKTRPELARQLWATGDTAARLVAILICRQSA
jgi:3-methyladenine DNA glycosylase AlkD